MRFDRRMSIRTQKIKFTSRPPPCFSQTRSPAGRECGRLTSHDRRAAMYVGSRNAIATLTQRWPGEKRYATSSVSMAALPAASRSATKSIRRRKVFNDRTVTLTEGQTGRYGYASRSRVLSVRGNNDSRNADPGPSREASTPMLHVCISTLRSRAIVTLSTCAYRTYAYSLRGYVHVPGLSGGKRAVCIADNCNCKRRLSMGWRWRPRPRPTASLVRISLLALTVLVRFPDSLRSSESKTLAPRIPNACSLNRAVFTQATPEAGAELVPLCDASSRRQASYWRAPSSRQSRQFGDRVTSRPRRPGGGQNHAPCMNCSIGERKLQLQGTPRWARTQAAGRAKRQRASCSRRVVAYIQ